MLWPRFTFRPRAHVNLNDGFAGNNTVEGNLLFASVMETYDHGPINTWNRMPYWTLNGVDDGFDTWPNVTKPEPGASIVKHFDHIHNNLIFTDFGATRALDHDDGSQKFIDANNVLVGSGVKNFLGNTKRFLGNLIVNAGGHGIDCFESDGGANIGNSNHTFINNTCIYAGLAPYLVHNTTAVPGSTSFREAVVNSSFKTAANRYYAPTGRYALAIAGRNLTLREVQQMTGEEAGSTDHPPMRTAEVVAAARVLLQMQAHSP